MLGFNCAGTSCARRTLAERLPGLLDVRALDDLPWHGARVRIEAHVCKFLCNTPGCLRRIFTERLSETTVPHAPGTRRAATALECVFRSIPITRFGRSRSPISAEADQAFRSKPITPTRLKAITAIAT